MHRYDADSILWNWARWCWSGETVGNMHRYIPYDDSNTNRLINHGQAQEVERLHKTLPHHEQMIVIAEYPQRHGFFKDLNATLRREKARRWIHSVTGVYVLDNEYRLYLGLFKDLVEKEVA